MSAAVCSKRRQAWGYIVCAAKMPSNDSKTPLRNLERVLDIMSELEPRLRSLERQAKRAIEYIRAQADLKVILREWYGYHWHHAQKELTDAREVVKTQDGTCAGSTRNPCKGAGGVQHIS